jgi:hypothetical protein
MIDTSNFVLSLGLQHHGWTLGSGGQTFHPAWAGPVSRTLWEEGTHRLLFSFFVMVPGSGFEVG